MNKDARSQYLDIIQKFKLATEANREAFASEYLAQVKQEAEALRPITPVLAFCMSRAGTRDRAEAIFHYVLQTSNVSYIPNPQVAPEVRGNAEVKAACFRRCMVPVKSTNNLLVLCGTNPQDQEGIADVMGSMPEKNQYPVIVLSEPERILQALQQFE